MTLDDYRQWLIDKLISRDPLVTEDFRRLELSYTLIPEPYRSLENVSKEVLLPLYRKLVKPGNYDVVLLELAKEHGKMPAYGPMTDGIDHINVYSKGKTILGRSLTNFAGIGFQHEKYGNFASVEGFWYWLGSGMKFNELRSLTGFQAKEVGKKLEKVPVENFKQEIKKAILLKVEQSPDLLQAIKESTLPFTHYYYYGQPENCKIIAHDDALWFVQWLELVRLYVQGKAQRIIIAGTRDICNYELVKKAYKESGFTAIEIVSGKARGVDTLGEELAKELELPVAEFPADWDKLGKAAGMIRNRQMGDYADALVAVWDGKSNGTKGMISYMKGLNKPVYVLTESSS